MSIKDLDMTSVQREAEQESDEDCEVYFLKPVNEYNIVDKIKEANKELFSDEIGVEQELITDAQQNRKVSFAANLEEYEPHSGINIRELEDKLGKDCKENDEQKILNEIDHQLEVIAEEEPADEIESNENYETTLQEMLNEELESLKAVMGDKKAEENLNDIESLKKCASDDRNINLEEICEEILLMDIENDQVELENVTKSNSSSAMQRKISKQITFDYTEDDDDDDELDSKSLTNLLISDSEIDSNDDEDQNQDYNYNESINGDTDTEDKAILTNTEYYEDDEEDDKLSIIVASYLPDDMACDKTSSTLSTVKRSPRSSQPRKSPFNKRFLFRRKNKLSNAIGCCSNHHASSNRHFIPPSEVTDLKLHYKTCCEFKIAQQKLPNYTGYLSEYGLSREQLIQREHKLQQKQQFRSIETVKTSEVEQRKMHDNERAFTTWLKNKMRFPINKTRNMFDVKRPLGLRKSITFGGATLTDDTKHILNTTKYRSISAKLKKC